MINNELGALDWRFHELHSVVDDFIVVESVLTHSGKSREPVRPKRDPRFAHIAERLHTVVIHDPPGGPDPWVREQSQREAIWTQGAAMISSADDDLIIISDVDEVPFPEVVDQLALAHFETPIRVRPHWFNFDWDTYLGPWAHASILFYPAGVLRSVSDSGRGAEIGSCSVPASELEGLNGWHASWFGSDDFILAKLASYAHALDDKDQRAVLEGAEGVRRRRHSGFDMYGSRKKIGTRPRLPAYAHLIW